MRISDWSSDVCSSDLETEPAALCRAPGVVALEERIEHLLAQRRSNTRAVVGDVDLYRAVVSGTQGAPHLGAVLDGIIDNVADRARKRTRLNSSHQRAHCMPSSPWNKNNTHTLSNPLQ